MTAATSQPNPRVDYGATSEDGGQPMADLAAERAVLGAMLLSSQACDAVFDVLSSRDFHDPRHETICAVLLEMWAAEEPTSPVAVAHRLAEMGKLGRFDNGTYLSQLADAAVANAGSPGYFAGIVKDWANRRRAHVAGLRIVQLTRNLSEPVADIVDAAQRVLHDAATGREPKASTRVSDFSDDEMDYLEQVVEGQVPHGLSSGIGQLDQLLGGFLPGQLIVPAGRPGMGKSTAGLGFAVAAARRGLPALAITLEMSKREMFWRLLSRVAEIDLLKFTSGMLTRDDLDKAREAKRVVDSWPLHIDEQSRTIEAIKATARRFRQRHGALALTFVDYLQRIKSSGKADRRDLEVGGWARELKTLGQELETVMVVPSQLNRGPEARNDKRPQLSDMRDSGEVEQEADIVILLHRDDYYDKEHERAGEADWIIAKHRNGPTDTVTLAAQLHYCRFADWGTPEESYR